VAKVAGFMIGTGYQARPATRWTNELFKAKSSRSRFL
jgi:hypothetical protein